MAYIVSKKRIPKYEHSGLSEMFSEKMKAHSCNYSNVTVKNYNNNLRMLCFILSTTEQLELINHLENQETTINRINNSEITASNKENIIKSIPCIYKVLVDIEMTEEQKAPYIKIIVANNNRYHRQITQQKAKERLPLFTDFMENVKGIYGEDSQQYLLISLYKDLTARDDFSQLLVTPTYKRSISTYNYIVVCRHKPCEIILNQYKTAKKYGELRVTLSNDVSNRIKRYINSNTIEYGDYLFPQSKLSGFVSNILSRCGLQGSISTLRRMMVSEYYNDTEKSDDDFEELAKRMGHSAGVASAIYHRVNEGS